MQEDTLVQKWCSNSDLTDVTSVIVLLECSIQSWVYDPGLFISVQLITLTWKISSLLG